MAASNSSGGVLGKMISPQNLAIGAAAVGLGRQGGRHLPQGIGLEPGPLLVMCVLAYLQSTDLLSWMVLADGAHRLVAERLRFDICGADHVHTHPHQMRTYESDGLLQYAQAPDAVVLPGSAEEVRDVVRACHAAEVPWVARGAGTGLSGGALPVADGILIVLARMRRVIEVDLPNQRVVVEPGVTNSDVSRAVAPGYFYPPDPSSQIVCSIGGNVAENSGGAHCFKYGFTTNYVTGLELVLPDGELIQVGGKELDRPGYDLAGRLRRLRGHARESRPRSGCGSCRRPRASAPSSPSTRPPAPPARRSPTSSPPGSSRVRWRSWTSSRSRRPRARPTPATPPTPAPRSWSSSTGSEAECEARFDDVVALCERNGATGIRVAQDEAERDLIWRARKAAFAAMGRIAPNYYVQDGVIPRTRLPEILSRIDELSAEYGLQVANVFHAGDGNLHPLVCYDGATEGEAGARRGAGRA